MIVSTKALPVNAEHSTCYEQSRNTTNAQNWRTACGLSSFSDNLFWNRTCVRYDSMAPEWRARPKHGSLSRNTEAIIIN